MEEELEVLESVYGLELVVTRNPGGATVTFMCSPEPPCFVSVALTLELVQSGPPTFSIDSKDLDDRESRALASALTELLATYAEGDQMGFQLIELAREKIEGCNGKAACQICLAALFDPAPKKCLGALPTACRESWVRSACSHQYHAACLARWWTQCVVNKQAAELKRGGDLAEVGREREALARRDALAHALAAALAETEASAAAAKDLQGCLEAQTAAVEKTNRNSKSGAVRAEAARAEAAEAELQSDLNQTEARASASAAAAKACQERLDRAEALVRDASAASSEAVSRGEVNLVASIPCPVCRSALRLQDTPFDCLEFAEHVRAEAKAAVAAPGGADEAKGPSCREHLTPDLLAMVLATQRKFSICTVTLDPCGDLPFTSWGRWQCLRGGADGLHGCSAACGCGTD